MVFEAKLSSLLQASSKQLAQFSGHPLHTQVCVGHASCTLSRLARETGQTSQAGHRTSSLDANVHAE